MDRELKHLLLQAKHEISDARRELSVLRAKCEVIDTSAAIVHALDRSSTGASPDIVWYLGKKIEELEAAETDDVSNVKEE